MARCYKIAERQNNVGGMGSGHVRIPNLVKEVVTFCGGLHAAFSLGNLWQMLPVRSPCLWWECSPHRAPREVGSFLRDFYNQKSRFGNLAVWGLFKRQSLFLK